MTQRDTAATLAWYEKHQTKAQLGYNPDGMCLKICRSARGLPGGVPSALAAQKATPAAHQIRDLTKIRPGMVMYFDDPRDGNKFGHIVTVAAVPAGGAKGLSDITVWSNSVTPGRVVKVKADYFPRTWGDGFVFAATWLNGEALILPAVATPKPKPKAINVRIRECSMQYSDTPAQKAIDAKAAFNPTPGGLRPHVVLFTEAGRGQNKVGQDLLRKEGERLGYAMFFDGYEGGIAIKFGAGRVVDHGYEGPIIPGKAGDHPHLGLTWATVKHRTLGDMTFGVMHWLNRDVEAARARINDAATKKVGAFLAAKAAGDAIGFLAGDANRDDKTRDLLPGIPFRTAADEMGVYPDTHGTRTIDFIASYDKDLRVRCTSFRTLPRAHSDHRWIEATYAITPRSAA